MINEKTYYFAKKKNMRILYFVLVLTGFICGCDSLDNKPKIYSQNGETIEEVIKNEIASGVRKDTIFIGLSFGLTQKEYRKKLKDLKKSKKLYEDETNGNVITYDLVGDHGTRKCIFKAEFYQDSLYQLIVGVKPQQYERVRSLTLMLQSFFMKKYSLPTEIKQMLLIPDCREYTWIKGNRKIKIICGYQDSRIVYEDLIRSGKKDLETSEQNRKKAKESNEDI